MALEKSRGNPDAELQLARVLASCHKDSQASAWYRKYLQARPYEYRIWYELGETLLRDHRSNKAAVAFKTVLDLEPEDTGGELGLARSFSAQGRFRAALGFYNRVLKKQPSNYDALQGKAFVLHWTRRDAEARSIFERLVKMNPNDQENRTALRAIARGVDALRWESFLPKPEARPEAFVSYWISYLADHPLDLDAMRNLAAAESKLGYYSGAIQTYRRILKTNPSDEEAHAQIARLLAWDHQYDAAIRIFQNLLSQSPRNVDWMESLAWIYTWAGRFSNALAVERKLSAFEPANTIYSQQVIRLELRLKKRPEARKSLADLLQRYPQNRWARLKLAQLDLQAARLNDALNNYDVVLGANFMDADALYGAARINYYLGQIDRAYPLAKNLANERPNDFDALLLLARIERARHHRKAALALARRALQLKPGNPQAAEITNEAATERSITLHTSATYARELAYDETFRGPDFSIPGGTVEDLNSYGAGSRLGFSFLPRSQSYLTFASTPSNSPFGGIRGTVAPDEWLYGQTTEITKFMTLRGGAGLTRLGPGAIFPVNVGGEPGAAKALAVAPIGFAGFSFFPEPNLSLDFTVSRMSVPYTPTSVRFGVMETSIEAAANYSFNPRMNLRIAFRNQRISSSVFIDSFLQLEKNGHDRGNEGSLDLTYNAIHSRRFSLSAGYSGRVFGYAGGRQGEWMGFFNPAFYQYHALALGFSGRLPGPVSYTLITDLGAQQANEDQPFTRAVKLAPGLAFRINPQLSISLGYVHYDFAESLGSVRGNAVELSTDWSF
ncbi:MAG: tetratricopeptide repeat protein [Terriglobia bacterium]